MTAKSLSDVLRFVHLRGAVFYYLSVGPEWAVGAPPASEIAGAVIPGAQHMMEYHVITKGSGWGVGRALALIHESPARAWTGNALAHEVALSRSAFCDRFVRLVGQPPMPYLTHWRMEVAATLLRQCRASDASIALDTGDDSEAAFTRAFKRLVGTPPARWRRTHNSELAQPQSWLPDRRSVHPPSGVVPQLHPRAQR